LPSPEPDRQAVPLDLFPSLILSDITIAKTFTPDMPGDFAGGSVRITTRQLPEKLLLQATVSGGLNTESSFADRLSYRGSSLDWLGLDGGTRALPDAFPDYKMVRLGPKPDGGTISKDELTFWGRQVNSYMSTQRTKSWPNLGGNIVFGNSHSFGRQHEVGYVAALTYGRRFTRRADEIVRTYRVDPTDTSQLVRLNDYKAETGLDQVSWGGLATLTYRLHKDHRFTLTGLHSRSSDNEGREISGFNEERGTEVTDTRLRFVTRSLSFAQLAGQHMLRDVSGAVLDYNVSISTATSDEPDTRETVYVKDASTGTYSWDKGTLSGSHFFGSQDETQYGGGLDWTQPLTEGDRATKMKVGGLFSLRSRSFDARRFHFIPRNNVDPTVFRNGSDQLFTYENIGTAIELEEFTRPNDAYTADQSLVAGYLMADAPLTSFARVILGARVEASDQEIDSFDPFAAELTHVTAELKKTDLLPSVNFVFATTKKSNLRLSATRTVARPQLRELAPFAYTDYFGAREVLGNPDLGRTSIYNFDLRFELFPTLGEVMALSVFYKHFVDPIEQVIIPTSRGIVSYQNAKAARNAGVELEIRKGLGFLAPAISDFALIANLTVVKSRVELDESQIGIQTNDVRPLAGQSPYVVNAGIDYSNEGTGTRARVLYNVSGRRIATVGASGLPDVYEQPRHQVDATVAQRLGKHIDLKLAGENLIGSEVRFTQGEADDDETLVDAYQPGATFTLSLTVSN
jgi:hypothetical protein